MTSVVESLPYMTRGIVKHLWESFFLLFALYGRHQNLQKLKHNDHLMGICPPI